MISQKHQKPENTNNNLTKMTSLRTCVLCGFAARKKKDLIGCPLRCLNTTKCRTRVHMREQLKKPEVVRRQTERHAAIELLRRKCRRRALAIEQQRLEEERRKEESSLIEQKTYLESLPNRLIELAPSPVNMLKALRRNFYGAKPFTKKVQKAVLGEALEMFEETDANSERVRLVCIAFREVYLKI